MYAVVDDVIVFPETNLSVDELREEEDFIYTVGSVTLCDLVSGIGFERFLNVNGAVIRLDRTYMYRCDNKYIWIVSPNTITRYDGEGNEVSVSYCQRMGDVISTAINHELYIANTNLQKLNEAMEFETLDIPFSKGSYVLKYNNQPIIAVYDEESQTITYKQFNGTVIVSDVTTESSTEFHGYLVVGPYVFNKNFEQVTLPLQDVTKIILGNRDNEPYILASNNQEYVILNDQLTVLYKGIHTSEDPFCYFVY